MQNANDKFFMLCVISYYILTYYMLVYYEIVYRVCVVVLYRGGISCGMQQVRQDE